MVLQSTARCCSPFTSYYAPNTESLCAVARAISPLTATLNKCVHPCATITSIFGRVFVCDISSLSSPCTRSFPVKAIGDQWRLKVTNHPSSPLLCPPVRLPHPLPSQTVLTLTQAVASRGSGVSFIFAPVEGLQGSEATEGNYSSALIGIIILAG